jgi:hypothetical protein
MSGVRSFAHGRKQRLESRPGRVHPMLPAEISGERAMNERHAGAGTWSI